MSDEGWSEGSDEGSDFSPESDYEDASFASKSKFSSSLKGHSLRKKANPQRNDASSSSTPVEAGAPSLMRCRSTHTIQDPAAMRTALLRWYKTVHETRGMPWRRPYDPNLGIEERAQRAYEVWISEIMLQQTQVATVIPYYNRWMEKFPTVRDLAAATIDEVNALWKGLGYYSRASRLLAGAQKALEVYGGKLPDNAKDMEANIPGIGRYSAGAICSIAYGEQVPVLDGNVHRLLSRILALHGPPKSKQTLDVLWTGAKTMVEIDSQSLCRSEDPPPDSDSPQYPGDINQAMIELGSTVCKVREPECGSCPLRAWCSAYRKTTPEDEQATSVVDIEDVCRLCEPLMSSEGVTSYPMKADRKKAREETDVVNVIEWRSRATPSDRRFLLVRRPEGGLLAGLYEFPASVNVSKSMTRASQEKLPASILSKLVHGGSSLTKSQQTRKANTQDEKHEQVLTITKITPVGEVLHVFSHIRKTYKVQWVVLEGGAEPPPPLEGSSLDEERPKKKPKRENAGKGPVNVKNDKRGPKGAVWTPIDQVLEANMGSGVVKVWNLTKELWEKEAR
ncbi:unnamed protein product [Cyclocybe aegerita]|uniref:Adenine DNA glycosylase n=1 Tax=Cyclocybe aegerita TaxID=1973307 RepID=A0A8S0WQM6_CYCAE|nr:unnamed protein product [Cyclocybe aegerita]